MPWVEAGLGRTLGTRYRDLLMAVLSTPIPRGPHVNVLQHMAGYFTHRLDSDSRAELHAVIGEYASGSQPLAAPRVLLRHHICQHGVSYLARQAYLEPYPASLGTAGR